MQFKTKIIAAACLCFIWGVIFLPSAWADPVNLGTISPSSIGNSTPATSSGLVPCGNGSSVGTACTLCSLIQGIANIVNFGRNLLLTAALVAIGIAGVMYIVSAGSEEMMKTAKSFLTASLTGFAIVLGAYLIITTVLLVISAKNDLGTGTSINWTTGTVNLTCNSKSTAGAGGSSGTSTANPASPASAANQAAAQQQIAQQQQACNTWCNQAGGDPTYTASCNAGCAQQATTAQQAASNPSNGNANGQNGQSNNGLVNSAQNMMGNCGYCNVPQNNPAGCSLNGCSGNPPYADCSNFASTMYKNNGYSSPGGTTAQMYTNGQNIDSSTTYNAGDLIVTQSSTGGASNHVVMCEDDGCSTVIHDSGVKDAIKESNGSYYQQQPGARVIRAANYANS